VLPQPGPPDQEVQQRLLRLHQVHHPCARLHREGHRLCERGTRKTTLDYSGEMLGCGERAGPDLI
jgi:hypothetical protein